MAGTKRLMIDAEGSGTSDTGSFGKATAPDRGDQCLVDVDMIAIPGPGKDSVASPLALLRPEEEALFSFFNLVKFKSQWPPTSVLKSKCVRCGVKPSQYPTLVKRLAEANMVTLLSYDHSVLENAILAVSKKVGISQRLIWAGDRSNLLHRKHTSAVELPTTDIVSSLFLDEGEELFSPTVTCRNTTSVLAPRLTWFRSSAFRELEYTRPLDT